VQGVLHGLQSWISAAEWVFSIGCSSSGKHCSSMGSLWATVPVRKHPNDLPWALPWAAGNTCPATWSSSFPLLL